MTGFRRPACRAMLLLALACCLSACVASTALVAAVPAAVPLAIAVAVEGTSVAVFGRGVLDMGVSAITGRDCSIVRLDRRQSYCAPREQLAEAPPLCSRTLGGNVTCWVDPQNFPIQPRQVADTPGETREQVREVKSNFPVDLNVPNQFPPRN
jgi:hypothetical protein